MESKQENLVLKAMRNLVIAMNWDEDDNFEETPERFLKWLKQYQSKSSEKARDDAVQHLKNTFETDNQNLVMVGPSKIYSLCPHHLQVIEYDIWIAYLPDKVAVGLSKLARVPMEIAKYPFIQEEFTQHVADIIDDELETKGVMVVVKGIHNCMRVRGVKQGEAVTMTSAITGYFAKPKDGKNPKAEVLELIKIGKWTL